MKRTMGSLFVTLLSFWSFASPLQSQDAPKALLFIRGGSADWEFMLSREAGVIHRVLQEAGIEVDVATASGDPISAGSINFTPDLRLRDVVITDYSAFVLPCMAAGTYVAPGAVVMVREAAAAGKLVAAEYNSAFTLAEAGLLKGKKYALGAEVDPARYPGFEEAVYSGSGVVQDGNLITSGICPYMARQRGVPDQTEEFAGAIVDAITGGG